MINMTEGRTNCSICDSESLIIACLCNQLLDRGVEQNLISFPELQIVELNRIQEDCNLYYDELPHISRLQSELYTYQLHLGHCKDIVKNAKETLILDIDQIFNEVTDWLLNLTEEVQRHTEILKNYKSTLSAEGKQLIETYRSKGFGDTVSHYLKEVNIDVQDTLKYIKSKFNFIYHYTPEIKQEEDETLYSTDYSGNLDTHCFISSDRASEYMDINIINYKTEIAYKDNLINEYHEFINKLVAQIAQYEEQVAEQAREITKLNTSCLNYENETNKLKSYINSIQAKPNSSISKLEKTQKKLKISNKVLKNELRKQRSYSRHINKLESELKELRSSQKDTIDSSNRIEEMKSELTTLRNYKYIQDTLNGHNSSIPSTSDDNLCIYIPQHFTKRLLKIDVISGKVDSIDMSITDECLYYTTTCLLDNGDLICARSRPASREVYILKSKEYDSIRLSNLHYPRSYYSLFYYQGFVYAFGGKDNSEKILKTAERLRVDRYNNRWEKLPNMKSHKMLLSCVGIKDKIYLFDGCSTAINFLDILSIRFQIVKINNIETELEAVAYKYNDRIYLLTSNYTQIYDLNLNKLYQYQHLRKYKRYSMNNLISYNNTIYFYNDYTLALEKISMPTSDIQDTLNKYIYKTRSNSHDLHRIDVQSHKLEVLDLSMHLHSKFYDTSITLLHNGDVFIAGFRYPFSGACYIFNSIEGYCTRIQNMLTPRYFMSLFYYEFSIYAFGGQTEPENKLKTAEKFMLVNGKWNKLPDMMKERRSASCICIDHNIYIFGGDNESVEIYDIKSNKFTLSSLTLYCDVVAVRVNELIYLLGENDYSVLSKDLEILDQTETITSESSSIYSLGNSVTYKGYIYFYNNSMRLLERMNIQTRERGIVIIE